MPPTTTSCGELRGRYYGASPTLRTESVASPSTAVSFMTDSKGERRSIMSPPLTLHVVSSDGIDLDSRGSHIRQHTSSRILSIHEATELQHGLAFDTSKNGRRDLLPTIKRDTCDELRRQRSITVPLAYQRATDHCESKSGFGKLVDRVRHPRTWRKYKEGLAVISKRTTKTHERDHSPQTTTAHSFLHQIPAFDTKSTPTHPTNDSHVYLTVKETLEQEAIQRAKDAKTKAKRSSMMTGRLYKSQDTEARDIGHVTGSLCSRVTHRFGDLWKGSVSRKVGTGPERVRLRKKNRKAGINSADDSIAGPDDNAAARALRAQPSLQIRRTMPKEAIRNVPSRASSHGSNRSYRSALPEEFFASNAQQDPPFSLSTPHNLPWSPPPMPADPEGRTKVWADMMMNSMMNSRTWRKTPSLASTLGSVSRTSSRRAGSETSSLMDFDDGQSAYEFDAVRRTNQISRQSTGLSGTTLGTSPVSQKSSNVPWASKKSGKPSKYVLEVEKLPSAFSLDSVGKRSIPTTNFHILDTRFPLHDQPVAV